MFNNGGDQNLDEFTQQLLEKLITATRLSNTLPTEDEYQFYSSFKPFKSKMNDFGKRLLDLTQNFLQHDETNTKAPVINTSDDVDEVTEKFDEVVDFVDRLIEKVVCLFNIPYNLNPLCARNVRTPTHAYATTQNATQARTYARMKAQNHASTTPLNFGLVLCIFCEKKERGNPFTKLKLTSQFIVNIP